MLAIALVVLAQLGPAGVSLNGPIFPGPKGVARAAFEFAPADGTGMGAACAGTTPTGARGETLTFGRASAATCIKGNTTSLANGDMVVLASDQPRVMPGGDGTGGLGILVERGTINLAARSEQIDNALWVKAGTGVAAPVVTPDMGVSPTGLTEADSVTFAATPSAGQESMLYMTGACPVGSATASVWLKGVVGSGTIQLIINIGGSGTCSVCSFNSTSWTRCSVTGTVVSSGNFRIGNQTVAGYTCSSPPLAQQSVYAWGAQCESGATATSYVPAVTAATARVAEMPVSMPISFANKTTASISVTVSPLEATPGSFGLVSLGGASAWNTILGNDPQNYNRLYVGGAAVLTTPVIPATGTHRVVAYWGGGTAANVVNGVQNYVAATPSTGASIDRITVGYYYSSNCVSGMYKQVCVDPDSTRCR